MSDHDDANEEAVDNGGAPVKPSDWDFDDIKVPPARAGGSAPSSTSKISPPDRPATSMPRSISATTPPPKAAPFAAPSKVVPPTAPRPLGSPSGPMTREQAGAKPGAPLVPPPPGVRTGSFPTSSRSVDAPLRNDSTVEGPPKPPVHAPGSGLPPGARRPLPTAEIPGAGDLEATRAYKALDEPLADESSETDETDLAVDDEPEDDGPRHATQLPRPGLTERSVQRDFRDPVSQVDRRSAAPPSVAPFVRGIVPPPLSGAVPETTNRNDTQALIADVASELFAEAERREAERRGEPEQIEPTELPRPPISEDAHTIAVNAADVFPPKRSAGGWIVTGIVGAVGLGLVLWSLVPGDEAARAPSPTAHASADELGPNGARLASAGKREKEPTAVAGEQPAALPPVAEAAEDPPSEPPEEAAEAPSEDPPPQVDPEPVAMQTKSSTKASSKSVSRTRTKTPEAKAEPSPAPAAKPTAKPAPAANKSAAQLLTEAKSANSSGQASKAYELASMSHRKGGGSDAAEVMAHAACKMKNRGRAESAIKEVRLLRRPHVKSLCRSAGVNL